MPTPFTADETAHLADALTRAVDTGVTPGGVVVCGTPGGERHTLTAGVVAPGRDAAPPDADTVYDIASLTKVLATWPLVGQAIGDGLLALDTHVRELLPPFPGPAPSGEVTVRQILTHTSGLMAATRLDQYTGRTEPLHELLCREPLDEPPGEHRYLNRGFILLGLALAHRFGRPLDVCASELWRELGLTATVYGPVARGPHVAPTGSRLVGAPPVLGSVHDENAGRLGGVAGHAGVFSTPADLARYAESLLAAHGQPASVLGNWLHASLGPQTAIEPGVHRGLAWLVTDTETAYHHGWTGTSLFVAPTRGRYAVVCTNALHFGEGRARVAELRAAVLSVMEPAA